jgi:hypothetical protein
MNRLMDRRPYRRALLAASIAVVALTGFLAADRPADAAGLAPAAFVPIGRLDNTQTGLQVQNPTEFPVDVAVRWVEPTSGEEESQTATRGLAGGASTTFPRKPGGHLAAQVLADGPVAVTVNHIEDGYGVASSPGFTRGARKLFLPLLLRDHYGFSTRVAIQNVTGTQTTVKLIYGKLDGTPLEDREITLVPYGAMLLDPPKEMKLPEKDGRFSGRIEAYSADVVATVLEEGTFGGKGRLLAYAGLPERMAGTTLPVPLLMANNAGYHTGSQIMNAGSQATTVEVTFSANVAGEQCKQPQSRHHELEPGASWTLQQFGDHVDDEQGFDEQFATCRYVGSAVVTNAPGYPATPLLGIVNQLGNRDASAYEVVGNEQHGTVARIPLLLSHNYEFGSGVQVQNVGAGGNTVSFTYGTNTADGKVGLPLCPTPAVTEDEAKQLGAIRAGRSANVLQLHLKDQAGNPCQYVGSATVTGTDRVAAVVNQRVPDTAYWSVDQMSTYVTAPW